jgi:hypothetical protein
VDINEPVKSAFIVTSAVFAGRGSEEERKNQTQKTVDSINELGGYEVFLFDSTGSPNISGCNVVDVSEHYGFFAIKKLVDIAPDLNINGFKEGYLKNLSEIQIMLIALDSVDFSSFKRVFKISGRYCLTEFFNDSEHEKITLRRFSSTWSSDITGIKKRTVTSLWSFSPEYIEEVKRVLIKSFGFILKKPYSNGCSDIEHTFAEFFNKDYVKCIPVMGVYGKVNNRREIHS